MMTRNLPTSLDRWFDGFFRGIDAPAETSPSLDVWEDAEAWYFAAELPGFADDEVEVTLHDGRLAIVAEHVEETGDEAANDEQEVTWHRRERVVTRKARTMRLPRDIDVDKAEASLDNGVLNIRVPKAANTKPRRLPLG